MKCHALLFLSLLFAMANSNAQVAPDCTNAIPICSNTPVNGGTDSFGIDDFGGSIRSGCLEETLSGAIESNSAWYRFRTGESGQLGFNIGIDTAEDWDFALYKSSDCSDLGEPIRCNFFDNQDENAFIGVGEDPSGDSSNVQYEAWLDVQAGEDYYLLINNFSNINSGFSIQFSGSIFIAYPDTALDCSIVSNLLGPPVSACEGETVILDATTSGATYDWQMDSGNGFQPISGEHAPTLSVSQTAMYWVRVTTLAETIDSYVQVAFSAVPVANPVSDDASCSGSSMYDLSIKDAEALGSQSPNDYLVSYHESQNDAINGINILPKQYTINFGSRPIFVRVTSLNNPKCFDATQQFQLTALETPSIDFPLEGYLCATEASVTIGEAQANTNYTYSWDTGETTPSISVTAEGDYTLTITNAQNGLSCSETAIISVTESIPPQITEVIIEDLRNNNKVTLIVENEDSFEYRLDDEPYQSAYVWHNVLPGAHTITVNDPKGCGAITEDIVVVGFPKFFTPNGDSTNSQWHIEGLSYLENPIVFIYDRYGKLMKQLTSNDLGWDGTLNGTAMPSADYWFKLTYEANDGERITAKYVNNHFALKR